MGLDLRRYLDDAERHPDEYAEAPAPRLDDVGNAERFWRRHRDRVRFVARWGRWLVWDAAAGVWREDHRDVAVTEFAKQVADDLWREVADERDQDGRKRLARHAEASGSEHRLRAAVTLARGLPDIAIEPSALDADQWVLNVSNGTVDLRAQTLRPHDPADLCTKQAPVTFDADARAPRWESFLAEVQPDTGQRTYLQRLTGYALTGLSREHVLPVNVGGGANGKSTFVAALVRMLGDYATVARPDLLIVNRHGKHDATRAGLVGRRLVVASEIEAGALLHEVEVKELTGGDQIAVRRLYGESFEVAPTWTIWLHANTRPGVRGTDEAVWRRLRLIDWPTTIEPARRDPGLGETLATELPGILNWALAGCADWLARGLADPESVTASTARYRAAEDRVTRFLDDAGLTVDPGAAPTLEISARALSELLGSWTTDTGERLSIRKVAEELTKRGATRERRGAQQTRHWLGIGIKTDATDAIPKTFPTRARVENSRETCLSRLAPAEPPTSEPDGPTDPPPTGNLALTAAATEYDAERRWSDDEAFS